MDRPTNNGKIKSGLPFPAGMHGDKSSSSGGLLQPRIVTIILRIIGFAGCGLPEPLITKGKMIRIPASENLYRMCKGNPYFMFQAEP